MNKFQDLYDFVDRAIRSRKYPENTGMALKTALKLFEAVLTEEERNSISEVEKNLGQIYQSVFSKNKNFSSDSLATYKSRVSKVISDYKKYGTDPAKMANWSPKLIKRFKKVEIGGSVRKGSVNSGLEGDVKIFDFAGGVKLLIPNTPELSDALLDGKFSTIKNELKLVSESINISNNSEQEKSNNKE